MLSMKDHLTWCTNLGYHSCLCLSQDQQKGLNAESHVSPSQGWKNELFQNAVIFAGINFYYVNHCKIIAFHCISLQISITACHCIIHFNFTKYDSKYHLLLKKYFLTKNSRAHKFRDVIASTGCPRKSVCLEEGNQADLVFSEHKKN